MSNTITRLALSLACVAAVATPALAQVVETPTDTVVVVPNGAPGVVTPLSNATGNGDALSYSPTGRPADSVANDSAAAGNANQPSQLAPQGGGGGK